MSIALMSLAWQTALPLNHKAALLAMSDWANDDGASLHPSIYAVAERLTCSERTAQRLLKDLSDQRWIAVVGNLNGGKPGATRHYRINVRKLREQAAIEEARRNVERSARRARATSNDDLPDPFETGANLSPVTNQVETGDKSGMGGVTNQVETGDTGVTLPTKDPSKDPPKEPLQPALPFAPAVVPAEKPVVEKDTELQAACLATWKAYAEAYATRYGAAPVRNAAVNTKVKQFVQRLGHDEAPSVAAWFVQHVNDAFVVRSCHSVGALLQGAEAYRTQWATGRTAMPSPAETAYQRSMRERMQEAVPAIARKAPGAPAMQAVEFFNTVEPAPALRIGGKS
jgi:hypothetical protein